MVVYFVFFVGFFLDLFGFVCFLLVFCFSWFLSLFCFFSCLSVCLLLATPRGLQVLPWFPSWGLNLSPAVEAQSPGHWTSREFLDPGNINQSELSQRSSSQQQDLAPPNSLQAPVLDVSGQTTSKTGTQPPPSAERLPKVILCSRYPKIQLLPQPCLPSSNHRSTGTSPSNQEAYTSPWTNITHNGADTRSKRNYDPAACGKVRTNIVSYTK